MHIQGSQPPQSFLHRKCPELSDKSMILEVFTRHEDESEALTRMSNIEVDAVVKAKASLKNVVRSMLGEDTVGKIKKAIK